MMESCEKTPVRLLTFSSKREINSKLRLQVCVVFLLEFFLAFFGGFGVRGCGIFKFLIFLKFFFIDVGGEKAGKRRMD